MNFTPKMKSFCTFFFTPFLELNLLLENNSAVFKGNVKVSVLSFNIVLNYIIRKCR